MSFLVAPYQQPHLLVSVRSPEEALSAISGGCDILDIKEPNHGSLGMADPEVSARIIEAVHQSGAQLPVSAALGEVIEWQSCLNRGAALETAIRSTEFTLLKIGCAGLKSQSEWRTIWNKTRNAATAALPKRPQWVAVAYADWEAADAPPVASIVDAALSDDCAGLLIDTYTKSNRWLLDWITPAELQSIADKVHSKGLFLALAGSLASKHLPKLKSVAVDLLAIRGAACLQGQRTSEISESEVRDFKHQIDISWGREAL
jgi:uncharacterized protein (UPF0264 family)